MCRWEQRKQFHLKKNGPIYSIVTSKIPVENDQTPHIIRGTDGFELWTLNVWCLIPYPLPNDCRIPLPVNSKLSQNHPQTSRNNKTQWPRRRSPGTHWLVWYTKKAQQQKHNNHLFSKNSKYSVYKILRTVQLCRNKNIFWFEQPNDKSTLYNVMTSFILT